MKILQVTNFFKPSFEAGGVTRVAYEISRSLVKNNHEVTVFTTNRSKKNINVKANSPLNIEGMKVYYFDNLRKYFPVKIIPIPYYLPIIARKEIQNFDIIHIHEHRSLLALIVHHYAKKYNIPYVLQAHGSIPNTIGKQKQKNLYDTIWGNKILKDASQLIAVSNIEVDQYKQIGIPDEKIIVIPNGIDTESFRTLPKNGIFKKKYGISEKHVILFLGRLNEIKGIDFLIESYAKLVSEMDDVSLVIAGPNDGFKNKAELLISQLNLHNVKFIGYISGVDKYAAYLDADVLVYPSFFEIFGLVPFEAIMCGTPIIVTDGCGCGEIVKEANCGYLVKYGDVDDLAKKIKTILENPELSSSFVEIGKRYICNNLGWNNTILKIEGCYADCIRNF